MKDQECNLEFDIDDLSEWTNLLNEPELLDDWLTQLDDGVLLSTKLTAELLSRLPKDETVEYEDGMQLQCCDEGEGTFYQLLDVNGQTVKDKAGDLKLNIDDLSENDKFEIE